MKNTKIFVSLLLLGVSAFGTVCARLVALHTPDDHTVYMEKELFEREDILHRLIDRDATELFREGHNGGARAMDYDSLNSVQQRKHCKHYVMQLPSQALFHAVETQNEFLFIVEGESESAILRSGSQTFVKPPTKGKRVDARFYQGSFLNFFEMGCFAALFFTDSFRSQESFLRDSEAMEFNIAELSELIGAARHLFDGLPRRLKRYMGLSDLNQDAERTDGDEGSLAQHSRRGNDSQGRSLTEAIIAMGGPDGQSLINSQSVHIGKDNYYDERELVYCNLSNKGIIDLDGIELIPVETQVLDLSGNYIEDLGEGLFAEFRLPHLQAIIFAGNHISTIKPGAFRGISPTVRLIDLSENRLERITGGTFYDVDQVRMLLLNNNFIHELEETAFLRFSELRTLDLSGNILAFLPKCIFNANRMLESVYLRSNELQLLPRECFSRCTRLSLLDLRDNELQDIGNSVCQRRDERPYGAEEHSRCLITVLMDNNASQSDDSLQALQEACRCATDRVLDLVPQASEVLFESVRAACTPFTSSLMVEKMQESRACRNSVKSLMKSLLLPNSLGRQRDDGSIRVVLPPCSKSDWEQHCDSAVLVGESEYRVLPEELYADLKFLRNQVEQEAVRRLTTERRLYRNARGMREERVVPVGTTERPGELFMERVAPCRGSAIENFLQQGRRARRVARTQQSSSWFGSGFGSFWGSAPQSGPKNFRRIDPARRDCDEGHIKKELRKVGTDLGEIVCNLEELTPHARTASKLLALFSVLKRYIDGLYLVLHSQQDHHHRTGDVLEIEDLLGELAFCLEGLSEAELQDRLRRDVASSELYQSPLLHSSPLYKCFVHEFLPHNAGDLFKSYYRSDSSDSERNLAMEFVYDMLTEKEKVMLGDRRRVGELLDGINLIDLGVRAYKDGLARGVDPRNPDLSIRATKDGIFDSQRSLNAIYKGAQLLHQGLDKVRIQFLRFYARQPGNDSYVDFLSTLEERAEACLKLLTYFQRHSVLSDIREFSGFDVDNERKVCIMCQGQLDLNHTDEYLISNPCRHVAHNRDECDPFKWKVGRECPVCRTQLDLARPWERLNA